MTIPPFYGVTIALLGTQRCVESHNVSPPLAEHVSGAEDGAERA